jgi:hypothetical protein
MKKFKIIFKLIIVILFSLNYYNSYSQDYEFDNFWTFKNQKLIYYDSIRNANNGEMVGTGYTEFMRWLYYWQEAVFNDGGYDSTLKARYSKYLSIIESSEDYSSINVDWNELGPLQCPGDKYPQHWYYYRIKGTGRCYFIEFDPQDSSKMFTGSPTGGLFYSLDGGESWLNGGTDFLPNPGIAHMKVNPFNSDAWYIATGEGHGYNNFSFSYGIFRTMNAGQTWESISNGLDIPDPTTSLWRNHCRKIIFDPNDGHRLFAVFNTGIYKTENALADADLVEWDLVQSGYFKDIHFKSGNNSIMYASGESIFWSEDSGNT